jgi:hypothetical protein
VLLLLSLRPLEPVQRVIDVAVAPLRVVTAIASPLQLLRRGEVRAAERRLSEHSAEEAEENLRLLLDLVRNARPSEPGLLAGRRFVHGEALGRSAGRADRLRVRVRDLRGIEPGMPVASGNAYVGRVAEIAPVAGDEGGVVIVDLVTTGSFHVGARVRDADSRRDVLMTVGGVDLGEGGPGVARGELRLAVHHPSDRDFAGGLARVHELFEEAEAYSSLSRGFHLGRVVRDPRRVRWTIEPELDYKDGLFWVVIVAPPDAELPSREPVEEDLFEASWVRATPLAVGDASPWRESARISSGARHGVEPGAAVTAIGRRLVGRVSRTGPWSAEVSFLGDPGFSLVAVARIEGLAEPQVLGRLVSLGRDRADGTVLFRWIRRVDLELPAGHGSSTVPAKIYSGSGDEGLRGGYYLGEGLLPLSDEQPRIIRLRSEVEPRDLLRLFVRCEPREEGA